MACLQQYSDHIFVQSEKSNPEFSDANLVFGLDQNSLPLQHEPSVARKVEVLGTPQNDFPSFQIQNEQLPDSEVVVDNVVVDVGETLNRYPSVFDLHRGDHDEFFLQVQTDFWAPVTEVTHRQDVLTITVQSGRNEVSCYFV